MLTAASDDQVSYVNAPQLASERGMDVKESTTTTAQDYVNLIEVRGGEHSVSGTIGGDRGEPRIVAIDGHKVDVPPVSHLLVVRNDDRNGMVALVARTLAEAGVGIENMSLGKSPDAPTALMAIATYETVPAATLDQLRAADGISGVAAVDEV